jgi:hypothetical protein
VYLGVQGGLYQEIERLCGRKKQVCAKTFFSGGQN